MQFLLFNVTWLLRKANLWVVISFTVSRLPLVLLPSLRNLPLLAPLSFTFPVTHLGVWDHLPHSSCAALALRLTRGLIPLCTAAAALTLAQGPARIVSLLPQADALWSLSYPNRFYGLSFHAPTPSAWAHLSFGLAM